MIPVKHVGLAWLVGLLGMAPAWGVEPPESLEAAIQGGINNHPEIMAAQAKINAARADYDKVRLEVVGKVVAAWGEMKRAHEEVNQWKQRIAQTKEPIPRSELEKNLVADQALYEQKVAELQFMTRYTGGQATLAPENSTPIVEARVPVSRLARTTIDKLCRQITDLQYLEAPLSDVVEHLNQQCGVRIVIGRLYGIDPGQTVTLKLDGCTWLGALQAIEDSNDLQFVMRDYGVLMVPAHVVEERGYIPLVKYATDYLGIDLTALEEELAAKAAK